MKQLRRIIALKILVSFTIVVIHFVVIQQQNENTSSVTEDKILPTESTALVIQKTLTIEDKIMQYFPRNGKIMIAIAHAESNMNNDAKGYNCYYNSDNTIVYMEKVKGSHSGVCKKHHRVYAWSVDCFVLQKNYKGKECPTGVTLDQHLQEVADLSRAQGLEAWSSYRNGKHLVYLEK